MLRGIGLHRRFGQAFGLSNVSLEVPPGKIVCVIGPSGGGKSTLLRTLCLVERPDRGVIVLDGERFEFPGSEATPPWPVVTMVFQQLFLWPHLSLRENILLPLRSRGYRYHRDLDEIIEQLQMAPYLDRYPNQASLGQRQRVALARALVLRPRYLLLDEITSALDVEQIAAVVRLLESVKEGGVGVVVTTHVLGFARQVADRIAFLEDGEILAQGDAELLEQPRQERLAAFLAMLG